MRGLFGIAGTVLGLGMVAVAALGAFAPSAAQASTLAAGCDIGKAACVTKTCTTGCPAYSTDSTCEC